MARELGPKNIHVAHTMIDGMIDNASIRENIPGVDQLRETDQVLNPDHIAQNYVMLHKQPRTAWTHELDLRPWKEKWWEEPLKPPKVEFTYDLASRNVFLADQVIRGIEARIGVTFTYAPCLLGGNFKATGNQPPFMTFANVKGKMEDERVEVERFISKHGLTRFKINPHFPVNSLLLMRGAAAAQIDGTPSEYIRAGMTAMWERGLKMDDPEVFAEAMTAAGLDGALLLARANEPDTKQRLIDNTLAAVARGVFGKSMFFVGFEMFFGKERLDQVEEAILQGTEQA